MQRPVAGCGNPNGGLGWWALGEKRSGKVMAQVPFESLPREEATVQEEN